MHPGGMPDAAGANALKQRCHSRRPPLECTLQRAFEITHTAKNKTRWSVHSSAAGILSGCGMSASRPSGGVRCARPPANGFYPFRIWNQRRL